MEFENTLRDVALTLTRFAGFTANALVLGTLGVVVLVLRPTFASLDAQAWARGRARLAERLEGLVHSALVAAAAAAALALVLQTVLTAELQGGEVDSDSFFAVLETSFGPWYAARLPIVAGLLVLLTGKVRQWSLAQRGVDGSVAGPAWWGAWGVLGVVLLATSSFSGHAAVATPRALSLGADVVHLVAGAVWFAGIVLLSVALPDAWLGEDESKRLQVLSPTVRHFSHVAMVAIGVVLVTGVVGSILHVAHPGDLVDTPYGLTLAVKIAFFALILALGAFNHFVIRKRFETALEKSESAGSATRTFRRAIAAELAVGLILMGLTGWLTGQSRTRREVVTPQRVTAGQR
ncbi:MAG TPA: CopD family protein [Actinomycetota bacterium]|nr:CopD family protein [Actinomycetota bacterium]